MSGVRTARSYWIFGLLFLPLVIFSAFDRPWKQDADIWETAAAVRAASQNPVHPANPLLPLPGNTSPRFTPYVIFWGAVVRLTGWGLFTVLGIAGIVNYLLFVSGLAHWLTKQTGEPKFALLALIIMLTVWGTGYRYANAYHFGFFLSSLAYVGTFVYGICFHALAELRKWLHEHSPGSLISYTLLSVLAFVTHPLTAAFMFVVAFSMLLLEKNPKRLALMQIVPLLSFVVALLWPYFDYWAALFKGSTDTWFPHALFSGQIMALGPALVGIPIVIYFYRKRRHLFAVLGAFFCAAIYALCGATRIFIGNRFLLYGTIFLHIAIALYLFENWPKWWKDAAFRQPRSLWKIALVVLLLLPALTFRAEEGYDLARDVAHSAFGYPRPETPAERFSFLAGQLSDADIVLAEDDTGWPVPAICGAKLVSQQKGNPLIQSEVISRRKDAQYFLSNSLTIEERRALLKKYHVTHLLLDFAQRERWDSLLMQQIVQFAREQATCGKVVLYRVLP